MSNSKATLCILACAASLWMLVPSESLSQISESGIAPASTYPVASAACFYYISRPGELTMQVNIWGSVKNPGRYEVPTSTDLIQLISYAGGPNPDAKTDEVQVVRLSSKGGAATRDQTRVNLDQLDRVDQAKLALNPGDTIFIDHTTGWATVRDLLSVITTAAVLTSAIANVIIVEQRLH